MNIIYITSDGIGMSTGGGIVTEHELKALQKMGDVTAFGNEHIAYTNGVLDPFRTDFNTLDRVQELVKGRKFDLAHFYSGSYTETIKVLKLNGVKVSYTVAAHNVEDSKEEHFRLNQCFPYPHLIDEGMYNMYTSGYKLADVVIAPSKLSADYLTKLGCKNVTIVPHGAHPVQSVNSFTKNFNVGYLGQYGPDKGVIYLLRAWRLLNYNDSNLMLAGRQSVEYLPIIRKESSGNIQIKGFVDDIDELYNECHVIVQPSVSEGFGIEVLEAMTRGRPVIVSIGAGAADVVIDGQNGFVVPMRNPLAIADRINMLKQDQELFFKMSKIAVETAKSYAWDIIMDKYVKTWREL